MISGTPREDTARLTARIHGQVQGVGFRFFVARMARDLGLQGWVANEADGTVAVVAEGATDALGRLEAAVRAGPRGATVESVSVVYAAASGSHPDFRIRSSAHPGD